MKNVAQTLQARITTLDLNRVYKIIKRQLRHLTREAVMGIALLVLAAGFYLLALEPVQTQIEQLQNEILSHEESRRNKAKNLDIRQGRPAEQLQAFYKYFPSESTAPIWLEKIYSAARKQGIQLEQGEYQVTKGKSARLVQYQVSLPVKGSYLQLRKFLNSILTEVPVLSLDNINFERTKIGDQIIQAKIKLTLYLDNQT